MVSGHMWAWVFRLQVPVGLYKQLLPGRVPHFIQSIPPIPRKLPQPRALCSGRSRSKPNTMCSRIWGCVSSCFLRMEETAVFILPCQLPESLRPAHYSVCITTSVLEETPNLSLTSGDGESTTSHLQCPNNSLTLGPECMPKAGNPLQLLVSYSSD